MTTMVQTSAAADPGETSVPAELVAAYREQARAQLEKDGWEAPLASAVVEIGEPAFVQAIESGEAFDPAYERALTGGRLAVNTSLYEEAMDNGANRELAFKSLIALGRQNAMRTGQDGIHFPKPWVMAAAAAAAGAADLGASAEQQVLLGFRVFAAAAQAEGPVS